MFLSYRSWLKPLCPVFSPVGSLLFRRQPETRAEVSLIERLPSLSRNLFDFFGQLRRRFSSDLYLNSN